MRLFSLLVTAVIAVLAFVDPALAAETGEAAFGGLDKAAAGLCIAIAAAGGALAQGKTTASALDGIARNPGSSGQMFVPMILGLVLIESLVIYALVISLKLVGIF